MKRICYIVTGMKDRRVTDEIDFLKEYYDVIPVERGWSRINIINEIKQMVKIVRVFKRCDFVYSWSCDRPAALATFLCKCFNKRIFVNIQGGEPSDYIIRVKDRYDVGGCRPLIDRIFIKYVLRNATYVMALSKYIYDDVRKRVNNKCNAILLYAGDNTMTFNKPTYEKNNKLVVFFGAVLWNNVYRKGLETFVRLGYYLPDYRFLVIGKFYDNSIDYLRSIAPDNVIFTGYLEEDSLKMFLDAAKVICLPSYQETFGGALSEAMLMGCIPVATDGYTDFKNIVGDTGFIVEFDNIVQIVEAIKKASCFNKKQMKACRQRVLDYFSLDKRLMQLYKLFESNRGDQ